MSDDDPGMVQKHLINMARRHDAPEVKWYFIELFYELLGGIRRPIDNHAPTIWSITGNLPSAQP